MFDDIKKLQKELNKIDEELTILDAVKSAAKSKIVIALAAALIISTTGNVFLYYKVQDEKTKKERYHSWYINEAKLSEQTEKELADLKSEYPNNKIPEGFEIEKNKPKPKIKYNFSNLDLPPDRPIIYYTPPAEHKTYIIQETLKPKQETAYDDRSYLDKYYEESQRNKDRTNQMLRDWEQDLELQDFKRDVEFGIYPYN